MTGVQTCTLPISKHIQNTHDYVKDSDFVITKAGFENIAETLLEKRQCAVIGSDTVAEDRETICQLVERQVAVEVKVLCCYHFVRRLLVKKIM